MNVLALIIAIIAVILFFLSWYMEAPRVRPLFSYRLGLALLTIALILQFVWPEHQVHVGG